MSKYYIPRDDVIRHVVIRDDTDESLAEETLQVTFFLQLIALFVAENRDQAQSGRYTELQDALNKRKEVGTLEFSFSKIQFSTV